MTICFAIGEKSLGELYGARNGGFYVVAFVSLEKYTRLYFLTNQRFFNPHQESLQMIIYCVTL